MSFPARDHFERQDAPPLARVYKFCCDRLDFHQVRALTKINVAAGAHVDHDSVKRLLNMLVARGYLIEHARSHRTAARRFTLAHSVENVPHLGR